MESMMPYKSEGIVNDLSQWLENIAAMLGLIEILGKEDDEMSTVLAPCMHIMEHFLGAISKTIKKYQGVIQNAEEDQALISRLRPLPSQIGGGFWDSQRCFKELEDSVAELDSRINRGNELIKLKEEFLAVKPKVLSWIEEKQIRDMLKNSPADTKFDVILTGVGDNSIKVIKEIRNITGLGLKEAKAIIDGTPAPIKQKVPKEEAEAIKTQLEEAGADVEIEIFYEYGDE